MGIIRVLDGHIANQIAAGEVVDRPSSVVKELVENAIDAGSTKIDVWIEEGGLQLIRVTDNGAGMDSEDCRMAFSRHATSKIRTGKDLFQIRTLGFRGEALPSIAAVAKVTCTTSNRDDGLGCRYRIEGGVEAAFEETAAPRGTDILVKDLFYNTPARLKYMKTVQTEMSHISDFLYRLSLAYPNLSFSLRHNGNVLLQTSGRGDLQQVIASVYGSGIAKQMLELKAENPDYRLSGWMGKPEINRSNRQAITFIVNGRYIRSFGLANAVQQAYHTLLPIHRYPLAVLQLEMSPSLLDVNVHPAKLEVRFSKEQELLRFIESAIRHVLQKQVLIPTPQKPKVKEQVVQERMAWYEPDVRAEPKEPELTDRPKTTSQPSMPPTKTSANDAASPASRMTAPQPQRSAVQQQAPGQAMSWIEPPAKATAPEKPMFPELFPIGQAHGTYIIAQNEHGVYLIDQHAAHERINYEKYYELFGNPASVSQDLLVPITLEFTSAEAALLQERLPMFEQAGVYLEPFGGQSFIVRAYPYWLPAGEEQRIIREMAEWMLSEKQGIDLGKLREQSAILCSCKSSIKANESLTIPEMEALIKQLARCKSPYTCPHGRPIMVSFSTYELEKMFKRVM